MAKNSKDSTVKYQPNKKERGVRSNVYQRFQSMRDSSLRKEAEKDWELGDKAHRQYIEGFDRSTHVTSNEYDEIFTGKYGDRDWRARIVLPDSFAAIQSHLQEGIERNSRPYLDGVESSDHPIEQFNNAIMNFNMDKTAFDFQYFLARQCAAIRGTAFLMERYRLEKRTVQDPDSVDEDGNITYKEREIIDADDTYTEFVENDYIYIDETAAHIDKARDMVYREVTSMAEFKRVYGNHPDYKNTDKVQPAGSLENAKFFQKASDMEDSDVELLHYYNKPEDKYCVVANNVVIRTTPLPFKHKELPVAVINHYMVPGRIYGMGIPKIIYALTQERQSLRNLSLDRTKMSLNKMFLKSSLFDLDEEDLITRPFGLIEVESNGLPLNQVMQPIEYGDTPSSYYRMEEIILEDIRRATGIDDRVQGVNVGGTAFEAALLKEQAQKRINMVHRLAEMDSLVRLGRLKWSNIQFFYPEPRVEMITKDNKELKRKVYRTIKTNGKKFSLVDGDKGQELRVEEINGKSSFQLDRKHARFMEGEYDVMVKASSHTILSKPLQQAKFTEFATTVLSNETLSQHYNTKELAIRFAEINDEDPQRLIVGGGKTEVDEQEQAMFENEAMAAGLYVPPTPDATDIHTEEHLNFTETARFQELPQAIKDNFYQHIMGEHENNPNTNSAADMDAGMMGVPPGPDPAAGGVQINPADIQPSTVSGRDAQQNETLAP